MDKLIKVHCFDPGITTGYATGIIETGKPMGVVSGQAKWNEFQLYVELKRSKPDIIIYETFEYRNPRHRKDWADNVELFPRNLIGVMNLYVHERASQGTSIGCYTQTPAQGKGYYSDVLLRKFDVYKIANPHANDAMRHLLHWFTFGAGFKYDNKKGFEPLA
jgi:hypothetical protein